MKKLLSLMALATSVVVYAEENPHFTMRPSLSPDSNTIYFEYDTDIWKVDANGGDASRIIAMQGYETSPLVSPDGKWLTFASNQNGNKDVYIVSVDGGDIKQLSFSDADDVPTSWSENSKEINFESNIYNSISSYNISIDGGTPKRLFSHYFNTIANLWEMSDGNYLFNESTESYRYATRKGYKGDHNPNIKMWDSKTNTYTELTKYDGKDIWPTSDKSGNIYFASDRKNGQSNLMTFKDNKSVSLTSFDESIQFPKVSYDGGKVVFNKDYDIYVYDTKTLKTLKPEIKLSVKNYNNIENNMNVKDGISSFDVSPDGKKIAFVSRGLLFVSNTKGDVVKELKTAPNQKVVELKWADDNETIFFTRTRSGYFNLFSIDASGNDSEKSIYEPDTFVKNLAISNKGSKLAFTTGDKKIEMYDGKKVQTISSENEFWTFRNYSIAFSQDDNYLIFNSVNLFESDVYLYDFSKKEMFNITNSVGMESSPVISSDNKRIYVQANRFFSTFPRGAEFGGVSIYEIPLNKYSAPHKIEQYNQLFEKKDELVEKSAEVKAVESVEIDLKNVTRRWKKLPSTSVSGLKLINFNGKDYLFYNSSHEGNYASYVLKLDPSYTSKPKLIKGVKGISSPVLVGANLYARNYKSLYSINMNTLKATKININFEFTKTNTNEFEQMFYESWAQMKESFYDTKMHNVDWAERLEYYATFLPYVQNRGDLRIMMNDMLNELNTSHIGFTSRGKEEKTATAQRTVHTGVMFDVNNPYTVDYILSNSPADKIDVDIRKGDVLTKVNHKKVNVNENRNRYFTSPSQQKEVVLTFDRNGNEFDVNLHTISGSALKNLLYFEWEDISRDRVNKQTDNSVAYVHLRDMSNGSLSRFLIEMTTDAVHKDALILDLRFNNGGNIHNEVLEYLSQKSHYNWRFRDHKTNTHPTYTPGDKPIVVLINERSLSDAEITSNGVRNLGIGKLIGTETYRWIIFTSGVGMVDGSNIRMPAWGCYNLDGSDLEITGVKPDIYIKNTFEDRLTKKDPQLDRAIAEILKDIKK